MGVPIEYRIERARQMLDVENFHGAVAELIDIVTKLNQEVSK